MVGTADGAWRVVGAVVWPSAAITVVDDHVSGVERPMRRVSIPAATSAPTPTTTESLLAGWPELCRYACFIVVTFSVRQRIIDDHRPWCGSRADLSTEVPHLLHRDLLDRTVSALPSSSFQRAIPRVSKSEWSQLAGSWV
jgi:hypothetical protein